MLTNLSKTGEKIIKTEIKRKITWLALNCLMVTSLVLASCGLPAVEEEEAGTPLKEVIVDAELVTEEDVIEEEIQPGLAEFKVKSLTVSPAEVTVGKSYRVSVDVANIGEIAGEYEVILRVNDDIEETQQITLAAGATGTVNFILLEEQRGTYRVNVDGQSGTLIVKASPIITPTPTPPSLGTLVVTADTTIPEGTFGDRSINVTITCHGIANASARLRLTGGGTAGTILLTTGGGGTGVYRAGGEAIEGRENIHGMMDTLLDDGYKLVEVAWDKPGVWEGPGGSISLACRSATVIDWVYKNIHQDGLFAAQGNSGGSAQIAFSLAYYGLDEVLDLVNLGGGPPPCPISTGGKLNYRDQPRCLVGAEFWNESTEPMLFGDPRLNYPNTIVRFFLGENEGSPDVIETANAYYDAITSTKSIQIVPNTAHGVHRTAEGTAALLASISEAAR